MPTRQHIQAVADALSDANTDASFQHGVTLLRDALAAEVSPMPTQVLAATIALIVATTGNPRTQAGIAALAVGCGAVTPEDISRWLPRTT